MTGVQTCALPICDKERPKTVPLVHYLLCRFKVETDWNKLVNASQEIGRASCRERV